jgi:PAS domain S-box-containing protein
MSSVEELSPIARGPSEYEALVTADLNVLDAIPGAVYLCDHEGRLVRYNSEAARLWGHSPALTEEKTRFCSSQRLYLLDGTPLAHDESPMALAIKHGADTRNAEAILERPDGSRFTALMNIRALRDRRGRLQGAISCFQDISRQKAVEDELRRKHQDLDDFFENGAVGLHIVGSDGIILRANRAELDLLGYKTEEYVGHHIADFHADAPVIGEILQRLSYGDKLERQPARLRAKDGSIKHVLITSNGRFEQGRMVKTRCFTTDETALHEASDALNDTEGRLAATYEAATVGIAEADDHGQLVRVNDAFCKMLGRSREQLLTTRFADYTDEADRADDVASYAQQVRGEIDNYVTRKRAIKLDGSMVYLDVHSSSVRDSHGRFRYGVRIIQDVTSAKQMEDRIRQSERQMRDLLEALPAAVYTTDAEGRINFYNKAAVEMAGRTPLAGEQWCVTWRLYTSDGVPLAHDQCPMAIALKEDRPVRGAEAIAERPDGTFVPFIPYPTPLHDANGKLIGAINMLVDITDRKQAESRQKVLIDELNHRVKNTLATVQSLAAQTARYATDLKDFMPRFEARLLALARAHDLLTQRHWENAPLGALANEILAPISVAAPGRVTIDGPSIDLSPRAALSLTMALGELATNAVKYGAQSAGDGKLSVLWQLREEPQGDQTLVLEWQERDGPKVQPPTRRGFGVRLMQRCIEMDLAGVFDLAFEADGVRCRMAIPLSSHVTHG